LRPKSKRVPNPNFSPISASGYLEEAFQVSIPLRNLDCRVYYTPPKLSNGTVMICHHGAGYSGLSFACFAKEVTETTKGECGVLSLDARRHGNKFILHLLLRISLDKILGKTTSTEVMDSDLSIDVLVTDFCELIQILFSDPSNCPSLLVNTTFLFRSWIFVDSFFQSLLVIVWEGQLWFAAVLG
jgi:protein phosphatase methylesterase 1